MDINVVKILDSHRSNISSREMDSLPTELLEYIVLLLPARDVVSLLCVCRRHAALHADALWPRIMTRDYPFVRSFVPSLASYRKLEKYIGTITIGIHGVKSEPAFYASSYTVVKKNDRGRAASVKSMLRRMRLGLGIHKPSIVGKMLVEIVCPHDGEDGFDVVLVLDCTARVVMRDRAMKTRSVWYFTPDRRYIINTALRLAGYSDLEVFAEMPDHV
jgi:hypothetical protein